jgi:hypothetical protein
LLDEIEDAADEDGSYPRAAIDELRKRSANALANQYRVVAATIDGVKNGRHEQLKNLLDSTLAAGTGGHTILANPNPAGMLSSLVRSGELRLDLAQRAVQVVKTAAEVAPPAAAPKAPKKKPAKKKAKARPVAKAKAQLARAAAKVKKVVARGVKTAKQAVKKASKKPAAKKAARKASAPRAKKSRS